MLAGNCNASAGVFSGIAKCRKIIWMDAHGDYDTPDEAFSGYFDGMGVSMLAGESWKALMGTVPGQRRFDLEDLIYLGLRDLSEAQKKKIASSPAKTVFGGETVTQAGMLQGFKQALQHQDLESPTLLHLDLDCLDTSVGCANDYASSGGLLPETLNQAIALTCRRARLVGMTVASFDPDLDGGDRIGIAAVDGITTAIAGLVAPG